MRQQLRASALAVAVLASVGFAVAQTSRTTYAGPHQTSRVCRPLEWLFRLSVILGTIFPVKREHKITLLAFGQRSAAIHGRALCACRIWSPYSFARSAAIGARM